MNPAWNDENCDFAGKRYSRRTKSELEVSIEAAGFQRSTTVCLANKQALSFWGFASRYTRLLHHSQPLTEKAIETTDTPH